MADLLLVSLGITLIIAGVLLAFFTLMLGSFRSEGTQKKGGAVIIIGPFPIVFGSDKETARALLLLAILLVIVVAALFLLQIF